MAFMKLRRRPGIAGARSDDEGRLRDLLERVREGFSRLDAGEIDAFELDDLIGRYERSAQELRCRPVALDRRPDRPGVTGS
jgi:hypothetical protein